MSWSIFMEELISYHNDKNNIFFMQLLNLKQNGLVAKHINQFQKLSLRVKNISNDNLLDIFMGTLKDTIQHELRILEPTSLEMTFKLARQVESKNMAMATKRFPYNTYKENNVPSSNLPKPTRLTPQQMNERRSKGLCFNCDNKYSKGHKCGEKKLFYIDCEEDEEKEQETLEEKEQETPEGKKKETPEEITPTISCNALAGITTPQTLKIEGYIKKKKVIVLIDLGSTHNFIHSKIAKDLNCFIYRAPKFQVMLADGKTINCAGKCHNINLSMGEYVLKSPMGGVDVILGVRWLQSLKTISFNFQELFMKFFWEEGILIKGYRRKPCKIISFHSMSELLNKQQRGVIAQLCSLDVQTSKLVVSPDIQKVLDKYSKAFDTRKVLPPTRDHDHAINLILGSVPPNIKPYRYPYAQKSEIECMVVEILEAGIIQPSQSSFYAPVVMVLKKEGAWRMCPNYRDLNKLTIKDKFPNPVIDELLDELHGAIYFTKLDLR